jgi:PAS domain S-box-containing protein
MDSTIVDSSETLQEALSAVKVGDTESFVDYYRTFTNVVNRLRRQYLDLKDESQRQATALAEANESLRSLTRRNHAAMEFLNSVLGSVSTGIIVADRDRKITHLNSAAESLFAVEAAESLGVSLDEVTKFDSPEVCLQVAVVSTGAPQASGESDRPVRGVERSLITNSGEERTYLWGSSPLLDKHGESFGSVEAFQDITDTKRMERKMTRMESLAAIGEMAATVAHQVRNPLVGVKGFASLIAAKPSKGAKNKSHAEMILRGVDNLERVIDALLRFSRTESLTLRPTNLNRYLKKVVRQYNEFQVNEHRRNELQENECQKDEQERSSSKEEVREPASEVSITTADRKISVDIDQLVLREAIVNIIRNAQEAAEGTVSGALSNNLNNSVSCSVIVENYSEGSAFASFEIRDNGPGMSPETVRDIFRPFFTTKASGSGLGLPLARKLINAHGGEITVDSELGRGTTFLIKLPLSFGGESNSSRGSIDNLEHNL